jgi:hypothetical protein
VASPAVPGAAEAARPKYRSKEGNFEVRFPYPAEPQLETRPITGGFEHVAKTKGSHGTFLVGYDDTLKFAEPRPAKRVLDEVMGNTLRANQGKLTKQTPLTLAKHSGRAFEAKMVAKDKRPIRASFRFYVVRTRVYQLVALVPDDETPPTGMLEDFFDSFALVESR